MAKYQSVIDRKNKINQIKFTVKFNIYFILNSIRNFLKPKKLFHEVIISNIKDSLQYGVTRIRYHDYSNEDKYDSIEDVFNECHNTNNNAKYSLNEYNFACESIEQMFYEFEDIVVERVDEIDNPYIIVKLK